MIDEQSLRIELKKVKPDYSYRYQTDTKVQPTRSKPKVKSAEKILAGLMIEDNSLISLIKQKLSKDDFNEGPIKEIIDNLFTLHSSGAKPVSPSKLISCFSDEDMGAFISELVAGNETLVDREQSLEDCVQWIKRNNLKEQLDSLQSQIKIAQSSGDHPRILDLVSHYNRLIKDSKS